MTFKKQVFGFLDMLRFKKLVPNRRAALAAGSPEPLPKSYRVNEQARRLHPGVMEVELTAVRPLCPRMQEFTFRRLDADAFPFFRAGQYAALQGNAGGSLVSRPYCRSKWLGGEFRIAEGRDGRREADRKFGFVHPCVTYPLSDMEIEVPPAE